MITKPVNSEGKVNIKNSRNSIICSVTYNPEKHYIHCEWYGFVNEIEPSKKAFNKIAELAKKFRCPLVLNDSRQQMGPWPKIDDWLIRTWFPSLSGAGIEYLAHIHSKHIFTQISAQNILGKCRGPLRVRQFYTEGLAQNWLIDQKS